MREDNLQNIKQHIAAKPVAAAMHHLSFRSKIHPQEINQVTKQCATLLRSGIPLLQALDIIAKAQAKKPLQVLLSSIKQHLEQGSPFSEALGKNPRYFDELYCNLVATGEKTGQLDRMLERVAHHQEKNEQLKNKVKKALFYPCIVLIVTWAVTTILLLYVVPQFEQLFANINAKLPWFTQMILDISRATQAHGLKFVFGGMGIVLLFKYSYQHSKKLQYQCDRLLLYNFILGKFLQKTIIARFIRTLAITFNAGIPVLESLQSAAKITKNNIYRNAIDDIAKNLSSGQSLHQALQATPLFPHLVIQMVAMGEEAGSLDQMLAKIADFYEQEIDRTVNLLGDLLEPLLILILGLMVGGLIVAMYTPIFQMADIMQF